MSQRGRSLWVLGVVVCCLSAMSRGVLWFDGSGQEVLAATLFVPHNDGEEPMSRLAVDTPQISWAPYVSNLLMNNARATWFPLVCAGLNCEYGQLGTGGQGMVRPIEMPPLPQTWDHYDAATSRLTGEWLLPEPDYVFCACTATPCSPP